MEFEKDLKPPETKAIAGASSVLTAEQVADEILTGIQKGKYVIIPGFEGKLLYRLVNLLGNLVYPIIDWLVNSAQKKQN